MNAPSSTQEMKLKISLSDPRAIEIVDNIPADKRAEVIEKYIILGEMVASHASITTRKEAIEDFFEPFLMLAFIRLSVGFWYGSAILSL